MSLLLTTSLCHTTSNKGFAIGRQWTVAGYVSINSSQVYAGVPESCKIAWKLSDRKSVVLAVWVKLSMQ